MHEAHPNLRNLESYRKEAKRWLRALSDSDTNARARFERVLPNASTAPTLRDIQRALAMEQGFPGWTALKEHLQAGSDAESHAMAEYELMAEALLEAYRTGTPEAMERHYHYTWHRRAWQGMRTYVQIGLGIPAAPDVNITLDDARFLVAREHGFENWNMLQRDAATRPEQGILLVKPMSVFETPSPKETDTRFSSRVWTEVTEALTSAQATGIEAHGQMTDALLEELASCSQLTMVRCGGSGAVTDEGIQHLARLPNLRHLDLSGTNITNRSLAVLRELKHLEHISLSWTRVTDEGAAHLSSCERLQHVNISGTACGDAAIRALAGKEKLSHFMSGARTSDAGLAALHDFPVFNRWQETDSRDVVLGYDSRPNLLMLRGALTNDGMQHLRGLDGLFGLNLDDAAMALDGRSLAHIVDLPNLGWLGFDAKDDAMPFIAQMPRLRGLACQDTPATDVGWVALSKSQTLEQIWARRCHGLGNTGFRALSTMPSLTNWAGSCKNVDDSALSAFPHFPMLHELMPMDVPDASYRHIAQCAQLRTLTLMYCRDTTDAATEHVAMMPVLENYFASYTQITDRTPELLSRVATLESVIFDGCAGLTNAGVSKLARLPRLRELSVSGRGLSDAVRLAFPASVRVVYSL